MGLLGLPLHAGPRVVGIAPQQPAHGQRRGVAGRGILHHVFGAYATVCANNMKQLRHLLVGGDFMELLHEKSEERSPEIAKHAIKAGIGAILLHDVEHPVHEGLPLGATKHVGEKLVLARGAEEEIDGDGDLDARDLLREGDDVVVTEDKKHGEMVMLPWDRKMYLVPEEGWDEEHVSRPQLAVESTDLTEAWEVLEVRMVHVHLNVRG